VERKLLEALGADPLYHDSLLEYNQPWFRPGIPAECPSLPLKPHPSKAFWEAYASEAQDSSWAEVLPSKFPAFRFPIRKGISRDPVYRLAVGKGRGESSEPVKFSSPWISP